MQEVDHQVKLIQGVVKKVFTETGSSVTSKVGTMIEVPRAAFVADEVRPDDSYEKIYDMFVDFKLLVVRIFSRMTDCRAC